MGFLKKIWKQVVCSLVAVVLIGGVWFTFAPGQSTGAWLSDQEKSIGNSFTGGTLNLTVDGKEGNDVIHMIRTNLVPNAPWSHSYGGQWILIKHWVNRRQV
jgi:hypothetical protein